MSIQGNVDELSREVLRGWVYESDEPYSRIEIEVYVDDFKVGRLLADIFRPDLEAHGFGDGKHAFQLDMSGVPLPLIACVVHVVDARSKIDLPGSPQRVEEPLDLHSKEMHAIKRLIASSGTRDDLERRAEFLAGEVSKLLQRLADRQSSRASRARARERRWPWQVNETSPPPATIPRVLILDAVVPDSQRDAGSNAVLAHARALHTLGYEVSILPIDTYRQRERPDDLPLDYALLCSPYINTVEEVFQRQAGEYDVVYFHRVDSAFPYLPLCMKYMPRATRIFSVADLHHVRMQRQSECEEWPEHTRKAIAGVRAREALAMQMANIVITHSSDELRQIAEMSPHCRAYVIPWWSNLSDTGKAFNERHGVAFIGNADHAPNRDAVYWLVSEIMPLVWKQLPNLTCYIIGSGTDRAFSELARKEVIIVGKVRDLQDELSRLRLTVAPLLFGSGLKGKVLDSLAAGVPCICTPVAAEGFLLGVQLSKLIARSAEELAERIVSLYSDENTYESCRDECKEITQRSFSEGAVTTALKAALQGSRL
jgi:glycosyltransferase involved in cell wall biosynthesis